MTIAEAAHLGLAVGLVVGATAMWFVRGRTIKRLKYELEKEKSMSQMYYQCFQRSEKRLVEWEKNRND